MDILNWIYLVKNKLRKTTIQNPDKDLVILGADVGYSKRGDGYQSYGMHVSDFANSLMNGTDYIIVRAQGTPEENAQEFLAAYAKASDADRTYENRFSLLLAPGHYKFQETFLHNQSNMNIVSLTGEQDVIFDLELGGNDPFYPGPPAHIYDLTISNTSNGTYTNSLKEGQPYFLNSLGSSYNGVYSGFDSAGMWFTGNAGDEDPADTYPIYANFVIPEEETTTVVFKFVHSYSCSDQGVCVYLDGDTPQWEWATNSTRIAAQYNCEDPYIYGTSIENSNENNILVDGTTYIAEFTYNPGAGTSTLVTKSLGGVVLDTVVINEVLGAGDYRIAFSADSDGGNGVQSGLITSSVMNIDNNAYDSTVSGIVTMYYNSPNYDSWSENTTEYNLPLNVISGVSGLVVKNCTAGPFSFGANVNENPFDLYSTFENCTAYGQYSFGYEINNNSSTYINCSSLNYDYCFRSNLSLGGSFTNCKAGDNSFGSSSNDIYGDFINCEARDDSFNGNGNYGNFTNCNSGDNSFNADGGDLGGSFTNCKAESSSFRANSGNVTGLFTSCRADTGFGASGVNTGDYHYCVLYDDSFSGGTILFCIPD